MDLCLRAISRNACTILGNFVAPRRLCPATPRVLIESKTFETAISQQKAILMH